MRRLGKKKLEESESDEDDEDVDESVVLDGGNKSDGYAIASSNQPDEAISEDGSAKSNLEEEENMASNVKELVTMDGPMSENLSSEDSVESEKILVEEDLELVGDQSADNTQTDREVTTDSSASTSPEKPTEKIEKENSEEVLDFEKFDSAGELEVCAT